MSIQRKDMIYFEDWGVILHTTMVDSIKGASIVIANNGFKIRLIADREVSNLTKDVLMSKKAADKTIHKIYQLIS